jgi:exopolyphosphatase/guanosine-5'-triphosphate,3'-diphosphate pyrophosphatase
MKPRVAVIDVGSNSIKALVAESGAGPFDLHPLFERTLEVRISQGIGGEPPMLHIDRIEAGVEAVRDLWKACTQHGPLKAFTIVATSAVRSAGNGHLFTDAVTSITGLTPRVLSGAEEADGIAMGVRTDPEIEDNLNDFTVFDLGGGSLELIRFEHHGVTDRTSLPLGAVRLTEQFIRNPENPIPVPEQEALRRHVRTQIEATGIPITPPLVGCSGGLAALRRIIAARMGVGVDEAPAYMSWELIKSISHEIRSMDIIRRIAIPGMPERRADIFPAAMLVFEELLELGSAEGILHSTHNLRYGLALRLLQAHPAP